MTRIIISTICRESLNDKSSGWLYFVDLETRTILKRTVGVEPPYRVNDTNPRGGMRGMRGMGFRNGELAVANYSSILFFDSRWNLLRVFSHPSIASIHEIFYAEEGVWVTSTANDVLACFDLNGGLNSLNYLRAHKPLMRKLGGTSKLAVRPADLASGKNDFRVRPYFNLDVYDRTHLNSVCELPDGRLLLSMGLFVGDYFGLLMNIKTLMLKLNIWKFFLKINRGLRQFLRKEKQMLTDLVVQPAKGRSAVVSLNPISGEWQVNLQINAAINPSHSVRALSDGTAVYLNTSKGELIHFTLNGEVLSVTKITDKFLRGLLELPDGRLLLGDCNTLLIFDLAARAVVDQIELSDDPMNSIFDIQIIPPDFELPPDSLEAKIGKIVAFDGQKTIWAES